MQISIFGLGYVGSVSAVGLAQLGHQVIGVDIVASKVKGLIEGQAPVKEPQLDEALQSSLEKGQLTFTTDTNKAVEQSTCAMITVGTPSDTNGNIDLKALERCIINIGEALAKTSKTTYLIVIRSTVPPTTTQRMSNLIDSMLRERQSDCKVSFSMNPEFTREGAAVEDFFHPAVIVFGTDDASTQPQLAKIYDGIEAETVWTTTQTAELIKYTNNAFHALKVAFANEIDRVSSAYDIDSQLVMQILCADKRLNISSKYLRPGFAFGGSCLPKDLRGINAIASDSAVQIPMLNAVLSSNDEHIAHYRHRILTQGIKNIGVLGITFKAKTDDLRESPGLRLVCQLIAEGCSVKMTDVNLTPAYLMGRNKQYIDHLLPDWEQYFTDNVAAIFEHADLIVTTTNEAIHNDWIKQYQTSQKIIQLN